MWELKRSIRKYQFNTKEGTIGEIKEQIIRYVENN